MNYKNEKNTKAKEMPLYATTELKYDIVSIQNLLPPWKPSGSTHKPINTVQSTYMQLEGTGNRKAFKSSLVIVLETQAYAECNAMRYLFTVMQEICLENQIRSRDNSSV